jgi:hypothetical protein
MSALLILHTKSRMTPQRPLGVDAVEKGFSGGPTDFSRGTGAVVRK